MEEKDKEVIHNYLQKKFGRSLRPRIGTKQGLSEESRRQIQAVVDKLRQESKLKAQLRAANLGIGRNDEEEDKRGPNRQRGRSQDHPGTRREAGASEEAPARSPNGGTSSDGN